MKPDKVAHKFSNDLIEKCKSFTEGYLKTSKDELARRGQTNTKLIYSQNVIGKIGEELAYLTYSPYYPNLSKPDYEVYDKSQKSWTPDLSDDVSGIKIAVKSKDRFYADKYGPSWTFGTNDRKIFGKNLDSKNLDPNQYVCMTVIDLNNYCGRVQACVNLQWLHDNNLFEELDHKELTTKLTVRLKTMFKVIKSQDDFWQLKCSIQ